MKKRTYSKLMHESLFLARAKVRRFSARSKDYGKFFIDLLRRESCLATECRKKFSRCRKKLLKNLQNPNPFYSLDLVFY